MFLTEKHNIKKNHPFYNECDSLCFKSKNLYNLGLYNVRQFYFENKKYLTYESNYHVTKHSEAYNDLPTKVSCQTLRLVDQNFKSFFALTKIENSIAKIPKFLDKTKGRFVTKFPSQALILKEFKKTGKIRLSKTNIVINTKIKDFKSIKEVRIIPKIDFYSIEVVYKVEDINIKEDNGKYCGIDLGVNNLATMTFNNKGDNPILINGKPLKSINQYYNKKIAYYKSILEKRNKTKSSKKIRRLTNKRNNKVNNYLHKASTVLVNQLVSKDITKLVIGKNKQWKQDSDMGNVSNQNFVQIPHTRFIEMIKYKCGLKGVDVQLQEESYTSKASFLNLDHIPIYKKGNNDNHLFSGYRKYRGLYKIKKSKEVINADVNGSYNILRKAIPNVFTDGIEGIGVCPVVMTIKG